MNRHPDRASIERVRSPAQIFAVMLFAAAILIVIGIVVGTLVMPR